MIAALLAILIASFIGGGGGPDAKEFEKRVKASVPDKARREQVLEIRQTLDKELKAKAQTLASDLTNLASVHQDYSSTASDFNKVRSRLMKDQKAIAKIQLRARGDMKKQMTSEEWAAVFAPPPNKK